MKDVEDEEEDEEEVANDLDPEEGWYIMAPVSCPHLFHTPEPSDEEEVEDEDAPKNPLKGERNSQLTVGYKGDRSYVVRGDSIGVFNHATERGKTIKYYASISNISTPKGKKFKPKNVSVPS